MIWKRVFTTSAVCMSLYHLAYGSGYVLTTVEDISHRAFHLAFVFLLGFLTFIVEKDPATIKAKDWIPNLLIILASLLVTLYIAVIYQFFPEYTGRPDFYPNRMELVFGLLLIVLVLEITRRYMGWILPIICIVFLVTTVFSNYLPGTFAGPGYSVSRIVNSMYLWSTGVFGIAIGVASTYVFLFVLFATFFAQSGAGKFVTDLAMAIVGSIRGGPAKVSIVASGFFGTLSGSSVANIMTTGSFSIPLMESIGYTKAFAAAVESVASTGGMIMPPVMGAAAFVMAEFLEVPFATVLKASVIPAILFYFALFVAIDLEAGKTGIKGLNGEDIPDPWPVFRRGWHLLIPLALLVYLLVWTHLSPMLDAILGILCVMVISVFRKESRFGWEKIIYTLERGAKNALQASIACGAVGIIIGCVNLTGLGVNLSDALVSLSKGSLPILLLITMVVCIILGLGMIPTVIYITLAVLVTPALIDAGVQKLAAHFFVFFYGIIAMITPPVAISSYAAASLAGSQPMETSLIAWRLGLPAFILPFMFVYGPSLLMVGSFTEIMVSLSTSIVGISTLAMSLQGYAYLIGPLNAFYRLMLFISSICLIKPGLISDGLGFGIIIVVWGSSLGAKFILKKPKMGSG
jgi:TRAP transporter 4TM/12TM fusion protein